MAAAATRNVSPPGVVKQALDFVEMGRDFEMVCIF